MVFDHFPKSDDRVRHLAAQPVVRLGVLAADPGPGPGGGGAAAVAPRDPAARQGRDRPDDFLADSGGDAAGQRGAGRDGSRRTAAEPVRGRLSADDSGGTGGAGPVPADSGGSVARGPSKGSIGAARRRVTSPAATI